MSDLDLIAEALARQAKAERELQFWKDKAEVERRRCRRMIDMAKLRPLPPPNLDADGYANWEQLMSLVNEVTDVLADPYARYDDEEEEYLQMTHERARDMLAFRLQQMIRAAVEKKGAP